MDGFTKQHNVHTLVWYELHQCLESAINRERALKKWNRAWKIRIIENQNPTWTDLYNQLL